ncbi:MAG: phosphoglycerate kinase [Rhodobacteraceae bacterium]|nr:phosphoglycerate kinase [Paracoccaceae bacterium]
MAIASIRDMDVKGRVLVIRADLNAPCKDGVVTDATRIERFAAGLKPLLAAGARAVVLSHFGRPKGKVVPEMSLAPIAPALAAALGQEVAFIDDCIGPKAQAAAAALGDGQAILMENLRFHPGEEKNDPAFAAELAKLGDIYVNDAFSAAHRAHASTDAIAALLPACSGPLMDEETAALAAALEAPKRPAVAVVGGAKVSSKIAVLKNLVNKVDAVIIGGGMANTFFFADGLSIGKSLREEDQVETVREIRSLAARAGCELVLPVDIVYAFKFADNARSFIAPVDECPDDGIILDAGPKSVIRFRSVLANAQTILWNGPLGAFEMRPFEQATRQVALEAAELTRSGLVTSVAGGGDTVAALNMAGVAGDFSYVSTAGGAFLEWLEGRTLPGIAALDRAKAA